LKKKFFYGLNNHSGRNSSITDVEKNIRIVFGERYVDSGYRIRDAGYQMPGYWIKDAGYRIRIHSVYLLRI
jgi:hypothetical protein